MAKISQGNSLTSPIQQPGGKVQSDGYGLLTATVVWKADESAAISSVINRGSSCPIGTGLGTLTAHKYSISYDALDIATLTVDYVGIDSTYYSGTRTEPQITGSQGLTSENITAHPNFFSLATGFTGAPIAGVGTGTTSPNVPIYATVPITGGFEYEGNNGSRFQEQNGNKFLGFKKALYPGYYGRTNYLAPQTSFSGHFYTTNAANVTGLRDRVGKSSGTNQFNSINLVPDYVGTVFVNGTKNQLLLAQISFEDFGTLYKVQYEVRYNREGYEPETYALSP